MGWRNTFAKYPGLKWQLGSYVSLIVGVVLVYTRLIGLGVVLFVLGVTGLTLWKSKDELRYGWPPQLLRRRDRDDDDDDRDAGSTDARR